VHVDELVVDDVRDQLDLAGPPLDVLEVET
jgi:hypothetical protein